MKLLPACTTFQCYYVFFPFEHLQKNSVNANFIAYHILEENFHQILLINNIIFKWL
jgi:hypothetical protein